MAFRSPACRRSKSGAYGSSPRRKSTDLGPAEPGEFLTLNESGIDGQTLWHRQWLQVQKGVRGKGYRRNQHRIIRD